MVKTKTSIYIDSEVWEKFKKYAMAEGTEVSRLLEEIIADEIIEEKLYEFLLELAGSNNYEIDFQPVELKEGQSVSSLVRSMRDERAGNLS